MARNWMADLWPTSFKGVHFWAERDKHSFGKRLVVHEFPGRDDPFIVDLGAKAQTFDFTAYFIGDTSDREADALVQAFLSGGPGPLVLPAQGPVMARAHTAQRDREKDKEGYFAFSMQFHLEGAANALSPINLLGQLVFDANDAMRGAAATVLNLVSLQ